MMIATITTQNKSEGERRKAAALGSFEARWRLMRRGRRALVAQALAVGTTTADDIRHAVPVPPNVNPKCFGAIPGPLARAGLIRQVGFTKSRRAERHAAPIAVWELTNAEGARQWLEANPEILDPLDDDNAITHNELFENMKPAAVTAGGE